MELKNQVTSLKLSKKLKKLGVKQESVFYWLTGRKNEFSDLRNKGHIEFVGGTKDLNDTRSRRYRELLADEKAGFGLFSAFTVAELGEMLPEFIIGEKDDITYYQATGKLEGRWGCEFYETEEGRTLFSGFYENTEANARAKMLIYLIENKLLK